MAGVGKLSKFKQYPQLRVLMRVHNISEKEAENMLYSKAFMILLYEKEKAEVDNKYQTLKLNEQRRGR
jgi:hypothetical protein